ncbi:tripartite tricarboxylate transporter TctB family protein [Nesterenkonia ebinurensis]|uniref:tripartite tricarboxylate transporter TctB family protein n=1 Tax=Nesterenkonia ebinurensis TaxID=2608252 RepID=UPI00123CF1DE
MKQLIARARVPLGKTTSGYTRKKIVDACSALGVLGLVMVVWNLSAPLSSGAQIMPRVLALLMAACALALVLTTMVQLIRRRHRAPTSTSTNDVSEDSTSNEVSGQSAQLFSDAILLVIFTFYVILFVHTGLVVASIALFSSCILLISGVKHRVLSILGSSIFAWVVYYVATNMLHLRLPNPLF